MPQDPQITLGRFGIQSYPSTLFAIQGYIYHFFLRMCNVKIIVMITILDSDLFRSYFFHHFPGGLEICIH